MFYTFLSMLDTKRKNLILGDSYPENRVVLNKYGYSKKKQ